jgi:hypothetical protein
MVTTLKWGEAPVGQVFSTYFNAFAWLLPILGIIFLFVYGGIDGDVFTGICSGMVTLYLTKPTFLANV